MSFPCEECCVVENGTIVSRVENKMRFEIVNKDKKEIKVCQVDGCLLQTDGKKCDYLFLFSNRALLVELKGRDRNHAFLQLIETAEALGSNSFDGKVEAFIVSSRVPRVDTKFQTNSAKLRKRYKRAKCVLPFQKNRQCSIVV